MYETLDVVTPGSFRFPADSAWAMPSLPRYAYVSFITLATVGFGDVTSTPGVHRGILAWLEAVTGVPPRHHGRPARGAVAGRRARPPLIKMEAASLKPPPTWRRAS